jgi:hypothetical protein
MKPAWADRRTGWLARCRAAAASTAGDPLAPPPPAGGGGGPAGGGRAALLAAAAAAAGELGSLAVELYEQYVDWAGGTCWRATQACVRGFDTAR